MIDIQSALELYGYGWIISALFCRVYIGGDECRLSFSMGTWHRNKWLEISSMKCPRPRGPVRHLQE